MQHFRDARILGDPVENGGVTDCCMQQFSRGFWTSKYVWEIPGVKYTHDNQPERIYLVIIKSVIKFGLFIQFMHLKSSSNKEGTKNIKRESTLG